MSRQTSTYQVTNNIHRYRVAKERDQRDHVDDGVDGPGFDDHLKHNAQTTLLLKLSDRTVNLPKTVCK